MCATLSAENQSIRRKKRSLWWTLLNLINSVIRMFGLPIAHTFFVHIVKNGPVHIYILRLHDILSWLMESLKKEIPVSVIYVIRVQFQSFLFLILNVSHLCVKIINQRGCILWCHSPYFFPDMSKYRLIRYVRRSYWTHGVEKKTSWTRRRPSLKPRKWVIYAGFFFTDGCIFLSFFPSHLRLRASSMVVPPRRRISRRHANCSSV